jgi:hypothetical protein
MGLQKEKEVKWGSQKRFNTPKQNERLENPKWNKIGKGGRRNKSPSIYIISLTQNFRIKNFPQSPHSKNKN